jgi:hypothetical protein
VVVKILKTALKEQLTWYVFEDFPW